MYIVQYIYWLLTILKTYFDKNGISEKIFKNLYLL
jgi:hypothetical protein